MCMRIQHARMSNHSDSSCSDEFVSVSVSVRKLSSLELELQKCTASYLAFMTFKRAAYSRLWSSSVGSSLARSKSIIIQTSPDGVINRFQGRISRWWTPARCIMSKTRTYASLQKISKEKFYKKDKPQLFNLGNRYLPFLNPRRFMFRQHQTSISHDQRWRSSLHVLEEPEDTGTPSPLASESLWYMVNSWYGLFLCFCENAILATTSWLMIRPLYSRSRRPL